MPFRFVKLHEKYSKPSKLFEILFSQEIIQTLQKKKKKITLHLFNNFIGFLEHAYDENNLTKSSYINHVQIYIFVSRKAQRESILYNNKTIFWNAQHAFENLRRRVINGTTIETAFKTANVIQ